MNDTSVITIEPETKASNALATIDPTSLSTIFATKDSVETTLARIEREAREQAAALDISTERNRKAIKSLAHKVARSKTAMDEAGQTVKAEWLAKSNAIDADRRAIRSRLDALKSEILTPVEEYEAAIAAKIKANEYAIGAMEDLTTHLPDMTPADINERRAQLKIVAEFDWLPEFAAKAERIRAGVAAQLLVGLQEATQREIEAKAEAARLAAEAERQRLAEIQAQKDREEQIARDAAEAARLAAEVKAAREAEEAATRAKEAQEASERQAQAERDAAARREREAAEALAQAERDKQEAEKRAAAALAQAKADAKAAEERAEADRVAAVERERIAAERAEINRKAEVAATERKLAAQLAAERQRVADERAAEQAEADRRAANVAHRKRINGEALACLLALDIALTEVQARAIVTAVAKSEIKHITIGY